MIFSSVFLPFSAFSTPATYQYDALNRWLVSINPRA
jgi:hypothetical protein